MFINILTLFPEMFSALDYSVVSRARVNGLIDIDIHNIRNYSSNKHKTTDDYPFGGGAGMVMTVQPVFDCMDEVLGDDEDETLKIYMSPRGKRLDNDLVIEVSKAKKLMILCGHYEGIDERILSRIDMEISIGDYVLTGGELPAMVLIDSISRFIPEVLGSSESAFDESFSDGLLEYPHYTRPSDYKGLKVPEVLLSGHHEEIRKWRLRKSLETTYNNRPDLLENFEFDKEQLKIYKEISRK